MAVALTGIELVKSKINKSNSLYNDYQELTKILYEENLELKNSSFSTNHDITDKSYKAAARSDNERAGMTKNFRKSTYYGVVVGKTSGGFFHLSPSVIYVDVPLWNKKLIDHPETFQNNYIGDEAKLKQFEDLIFEDKTGFFKDVNVGYLVEVNVPENYPNHIRTNKADAYIINSFGKIVNGRKDAPKNETGGGGGSIFEAAALSAAGIVGSTGAGSTFSQLPPWAVTVKYSGLNTYSATELSHINSASKESAGIISRMPQYMPKIAEVCRHFGVNPQYMYAIAAVETGFQHPKKSPTGAGGLLQLTEYAITDSLTRGKVQNIPKVKEIIGNTNILTKITKKGKRVDWATSDIINLAKTNVDLNIWMGVDNFKRWIATVEGSGTPIILKAAAAYNGGTGKLGNQDNTGVKKFDFNHIRKESQDYIFRFNAYLNLLPASAGANIS